MAKFTETVTIDCPRCKGSRVVKNGTKAGEQRYRCQDCRRTFRNIEETGFKRRYPVEQIGMAIRQFYSGESYKEIAEDMEDRYNIPEPSRPIIYKWVKDYTETAIDIMTDHPADTSGDWVVDEMSVRVGGENLWNWNVLDRGTRYLLASHLSKERNAAQAKKVLRKALAAATEPPKSVTTDKLRSYLPAMREVLPEAKHIQSEGLRVAINNNLSERMQGTFRDRIKTLRGLDNLESGQRYLDGWTIHYNLFRDHKSLDYDRPGERAKVKPPFKEWSDVVRVKEAADAPSPVLRLPEAKPGPKELQAPRLESPKPKRGNGAAAASQPRPKVFRGIKTRKPRAVATLGKPPPRRKKAHPMAKLRNAVRRSQRNGH